MRGCVALFLYAQLFEVCVYTNQQVCFLTNIFTIAVAQLPLPKTAYFNCDAIF